MGSSTKEGHFCGNRVHCSKRGLVELKKLKVYKGNFRNTYFDIQARDFLFIKGEMHNKL